MINFVYVMLHVIALVGMTTSIVWLALRAKKRKRQICFHAVSDAHHDLDSLTAVRSCCGEC